MPAEGGAAAQKSTEVAKRVLGAQEDAPRSANRGLATERVPTAPTIISQEGLDSDDKVYMTVRASWLHNKSLVLNSNGEPVLAQYLVNENMNETPTMGSKRR
jgi:hypothetical protein